MKICPKCKSEIQEEARFCLYCMTSFEGKEAVDEIKEKGKHRIYIAAAILAIIVIALGIFILTQGKNSNTAENDTDFNSSAGENQGAYDDTTAPNGGEGSKPAGGGESTPVGGGQPIVGPQSGSLSSNPSGSVNTGASSAGSTTQSGASSNNSTPTTSTNSTNSTSSAPPVTQPKFSYIEATIENAYPTGHSAMYAPENAIVITKVNYIENSGNYVIPETVDGKKVAAVMPSAFADSSVSATVKSVTLPSTVRTIWSDAFKNCRNLTDLYIKSTVIGIYEDAFVDSSNRAGKLTIHCKRDCRDFNFYYYRNIADRYDANYEEWNG